MKLKELRQYASVDRVLVAFLDKYGCEAKRPQLEVLPSRFPKYDEDYVARVEAVLDTSRPNETNGSIQVTPCLQVCVLHREE